MLSALALQGAQKAPTIIAVAIPIVSFGLPILETALSVARRFISGRPVFTADREHIHHKLLQMGLSHRQVVIVLYAVSALFALLSLFLLWPTGSSLGFVLAVVGTGVWLGVQHLGYLEFGELRRVAQRTIEQRQIVINNCSIRRATEELKVARDYEQICNILNAAFGTNDFDWFDLNIRVLPGERSDIGLVHVLPDNHLRYTWVKPGGFCPTSRGSSLDCEPRSCYNHEPSTWFDVHLPLLHATRPATRREPARPGRRPPGPSGRNSASSACRGGGHGGRACPGRPSRRRRRGRCRRGRCRGGPGSRPACPWRRSGA